MTLLRKLFKRRDRPAPVVPDMPAADRGAVARAYARLFATNDGQLVMAHLQAQTLLRTHGADAPDAHIRYAEGQRALVTLILRQVAAGKTA
jgi:hypothetical protein